jgi:hypothetical protein
VNLGLFAAGHGSLDEVGPARIHSALVSALGLGLGNQPHQSTPGGSHVVKPRGRQSHPITVPSPSQRVHYRRMCWRIIKGLLSQNSELEMLFLNGQKPLFVVVSVSLRETPC